MFQREYNRILNGRIADSAKKDAERKAQHNAMLETFTEGYDKYSDQANASEIWYSIYSAHLRRKAGIFDSSNIPPFSEAIQDKSKPKISI